MSLLFTHPARELIRYVVWLHVHIIQVVTKLLIMFVISQVTKQPPKKATMRESLPDEVEDDSLQCVEV